MSGGLLVASGPQLFAWAPGSEPRLVGERDDHVRTLCVHDGRLYDGGDSNAIYARRHARRGACQLDLRALLA